MNGPLALALMCSLVATGCGEPARVAQPINPPSSEQSFEKAQLAEKSLNQWMTEDDPKALKSLVELTKKRTGEIFADPTKWPDCAQISNLAQESIQSGTIYGLRLSTDYAQRAATMGCTSPTPPLAKEYTLALKDIVKDGPFKPSDSEIAIAADYLGFLSAQANRACSTHSMQLSRKQEKSMPAALASVKTDCSRPKER